VGSANVSCRSIGYPRDKLARDIRAYLLGGFRKVCREDSRKVPSLPVKQIRVLGAERDIDLQRVHGLSGMHATCSEQCRVIRESADQYRSPGDAKLTGHPAKPSRQRRRPM
jgi:hypothetical protein